MHIVVYKQQVLEITERGKIKMNSQRKHKRGKQDNF